jgi:PAS domain S-box-containing protein
MRESSPILKRLLAATAYFVVARFGLFFSIPGTHITPIWPASGLALGLVLIFGPRVWPGIWAGALVANAMNYFNPSHFETIASAGLTGAFIASGVTLQALCGAWVVRKVTSAKNPLTQTRGAVAFILLSAFSSCVISATIGIASICFTGHGEWSRFGAMWWTWWLGDSIGVLVTTPLLLNWTQPPWLLNTKKRKLEATLFMSLLVIDCAFVFGYLAGPSTAFLLYTILPFLAWSAFRFGPKETSVVTIIISGFALRGTAIGTSPLVGQSLVSSILLVDGFMAFAVLNALVFSSLVSERRAAELSLLAEAEYRLKIISTQQEIARMQLDMDAVMSLVCERAKLFTSASAAVIEMCEGDELVYRAASQGAENNVGLRLKIASSFSGHCVQTGENLICYDSKLDRRVDKAACEKIGLRSMLVTPLKFNQTCIGVLKVFSFEPDKFGEREAQTLQVLVGMVTSAIKHSAEFEAKQTLLAERTTTLRALEEGEKRLRAILDTAYDAFIAVDECGTVTDWNRQAESMFGWKRGEAIGSYLPDLILPEAFVSRNQPKLSEFLDFNGDRSSNSRLEATAKRKGGIEFPAELTVTPIQLAKGRIFATFIRDITEQKRAELAIRHSEQRFRTLAASSPVGIFETDENGRCLYTNLRWQQIAGLTFEESLGDGWKCAIHRDDVQPVFDGWKAAARAKREYAQEFRFHEKAGEVRWVYTRVSALLSPEEKTTGYVGTVTDITETKEAEKKIRAALLEKEVLLKEIHHRVKNNLQVITSMLNLQAGYIEDPVLLALFRECQTRIKTIALIHEKLYQTADLAQIDFGDYTRNLTSYIASSMRLGNRRITVTVDMPEITFGVDTAVPCGLIINELVSNCFKHAFPDRDVGQIVVSLRPGIDGAYILTVSDDGVGLPKNLETKQSNSLGLVLIHALAGQLDGRVESFNGNGTTFNLTFSPKEKVS